VSAFISSTFDFSFFHRVSHFTTPIYILFFYFRLTDAAAAALIGIKASEREKREFIYNLNQSVHGSNSNSTRLKLFTIILIAIIN
jgi:hypothetical protein